MKTPEALISPLFRAVLLVDEGWIAAEVCSINKNKASLPRSCSDSLRLLASDVSLSRCQKKSSLPSPLLTPVLPDHNSGILLLSVFLPHN